MATTLRLPEEVEKRFDFLASQTGRSKAYYLREMIGRSLDDMEDYYLSADVLERAQKHNDEVFSAEAVRKALDLSD